MTIYEGLEEAKKLLSTRFYFDKDDIDILKSLNLAICFYRAIYESKEKANLSYLIKKDDNSDDMIGHFSIVVRKSTLDKDKDKIGKFLNKFIKDLKTYSQEDMILISPNQKEKKW